MTDGDKQPKRRVDPADTILRAVFSDESDGDTRPADTVMNRLKKLEQQLRISEARYRGIVESQLELICRWLPDRTLTFANEAYCRFFNLSRGAIVGKKFMPTIHDQDAKLVKEYLRQLGPQKTKDEIEYRLIVDGEIRWVRWSDIALLDSQGRVQEFQSVGRDVSWRKSLEQELLKSRRELKQSIEEKSEALKLTAETLRTIIDEIPVMICFYEQTGHVQMINRAFEELLGWSLEEVRKIDIMKACYPDPAYRRQVWNFMKRAPSGWRDLKVRCRDGRCLDSAWSNIRLSDGSQIGIGIDISERKQAEAAMQEMSRKTLEVLENDRQAVAKELHDSIGASLAAIKFALEERIEDMDDHPKPSGLSFEKILSYLVRTIKETKRISARLRPTTLDDLGLLATIAAHVREFCDFYHDIQVHQSLAVNEEEIPEQMKIVLYRVLQEALNNAGKHSEADAVQISMTRSDGGIELSVADNGCGFDLQAASNATDPLVGYGLQSMKERVEFCSGRFVIETAKGQGCKVVVTLPFG